MPKKVKSDSEWRERLKEYANNNFKFGQGQKPPPNSKWTKVINQIDRCPLKNSRKDALGRDLTCLCNYHVKEIQSGSSRSEKVNHQETCVTALASTVQSCCPVRSESVGNDKEAPVTSTPLSHDIHINSFHSETLDDDKEEALATSSTSSQIQSYNSSSHSSLHPAVKNDSETSNAVTKIMESPHRKTDFSHRLPSCWRQTIDPIDWQWIGQHLFASKGLLVTDLKNWWYPPHPQAPSRNLPSLGSYFYKRVFLWMPRKMWLFDFKCPCCVRHSLTSKGLYHRVRSVIDLKNRYYLAAEYLECSSCKGTFISYDHRLIEQLTEDHKARFGIVLTRKFACDKAIVSLMRARTLGNSTMALSNDIHELQSEEWMRSTVIYLSDCQRHKKEKERLKLPTPVYEAPPTFKSPPTPKWFLAVYIRDVWSRLETLKASATSIYGTILKIDSTKKITRKLQGASANSVSWCTNVGNEKGEVLLSILTTSESLSNLDRMAQGLMGRFHTAGQPAPLVLYTDRDCCSSKFTTMFNLWDNLIIRLDSWHFMRRLASASTNESHPLYGIFMARISTAIFEWDFCDVELLKKAKCGELKLAGIRQPSPETVFKSISKQELARHCRRKTRGVENTTNLLEELFSSFTDLTDTLGVPILRENAFEILDTEIKHIQCLQDPVGVLLYTKTGSIEKGGILLPVYRCGRGTTSLESFHSHIKNFIPGTSANDVHFQAFLLDGITRWNTARTSSSIDAPVSPLRSFDIALKNKLHLLSSSVMGVPLDPCFRPPSTYRGELLGVEYLYGENAQTLSLDVDKDIDEGIGEDEIFFPPAETEDFDPELEIACGSFVNSQLSDEDTGSDVSSDLKSIPGWNLVDKMAVFLLESSSPAFSNKDAETFIQMYENLSDYDKKPLTFTKAVKRDQGRFCKSKNPSGHVGQEAMKRCFITAGAPSHSPRKSRVVEVICTRLSILITSPQKAPYISRYAKIVQRYNEIRNRVMGCPQIMERTGVSLYQINETTLSLWLKDRTRCSEIQLLLQGANLCTLPILSATALPPSKSLEVLSAAGETPVNPMIFAEPSDCTGLAKVRQHKITFPTLGEANSELEAAVTIQDESQPPKKISRTTQWRKRTKELKGDAAQVKKPRKEYSCTKCHMPMSSDGHTQFKGKRFCSVSEGKSKEEWLADMRNAGQGGHPSNYVLPV